jgi:uncharacterized membrane protein
MTAVALAVHIFGAVIWVGGMFAIYVCLRRATRHVRDRFALFAGHR